jgi:hypothetical protein
VNQLAELPESPDAMLAAARAQRVVADRAEAAVLRLAAEWAVAHPAESISDAASFVPGSDAAVAIAGEGAPWVAEFAVAEFAAALGLSTDSGRALVGDALELRHRLPKLWRRVMAGELQVWRARRIAARTRGLNRAAARFVDVHLAPFAHKVGAAQVDRTVSEALVICQPDLATERARQAAEARHVTIHHDQVSWWGTVHLEADLDLADAVDFDTAVSRGAAQLAALGSTDTLDVRRATAVGDLARSQLALDLSHPTTKAQQVPGRQVMLYVHLAADAVTGSLDGAGVLDNTRSVVTAEQIRAWCGTPDARVTVRPVIDLDSHTHSPATTVRGRRRRIDLFVQSGCAVPATSPAEDPQRVDVYRARSRHLPLAQPARLAVPPRPLRHRRRLRPTLTIRTTRIFRQVGPTCHRVRAPRRPHTRALPLRPPRG